MNYRHAYHAGNHADVLKHVVLARVLSYLARKEKPYRVIDTHAGIGLYDLGAEEAVRSPEWRDGIARIVEATPPDEVSALLAPYLEAVTAANGAGKLLFYPGSPWIVRHMMRAQDRLTAVELHPADHALLVEAMGGDRRVKVTRLDGWLALGAQVPPKERRGLVLVDPPFEEAADWGRLMDGLAKAHGKWPTGIFALWYPIKNGAPVKALHAQLAASGIPRVNVVELCVRELADGGLAGCGLVLVNAPFVLADELSVLLPWLAETLSDGGGRHTVRVISGE